MKKILTLSLAIIIAMASLSAKKTRLSKFEKQILAIPGVTSVQKIDKGKFRDKYIVTFRQYIDHRDTALGTFSQRIILGHIHPDSVNVVVTEGYSAAYAENPNRREELSQILNANSIVIEHRYFNQSIPEISAEEHFWDYLTTYNAATDHHRIVQAFKTLYRGKYIATGASKGGICANMFRAYYPKDIDITVPYVAPFCEGPADPRMGKAIQEYGSIDEQNLMNDFIIYLLKNRDLYLPYLEKYIEQNDLKVLIPTHELYDYTVLDMQVALLARGETKQIPDVATSSEQEIFDFLAKYGSPEGFTPAYSNMPYYVQAIRELGHYSYNLEPFRNYLTITDPDQYLYRTAIPDNAHYEYDPSTRDMVLKFLSETQCHMIFIYGEYDPWTAVGVSDLISNPYIYFFISPGNCHRSKILTLPDEQRQKVLSLLRTWLSEK